MFLYFLLFITLTFSACAAQSSMLPGPAAVTSATPYYTNNAVYGKGSYIRSEYPVPESSYIVEKGDTLWSISKTCGTTTQELARLNDLGSARTIQVGQRLKLPARRRPYLNAASAPRGFIWPVKGRVVAGFGQNLHGLASTGLQIKTSPGDTVKAACDGQVVYAGHLQGWGQTVIVEHPSGYYTVYANLRKVTVHNGASVRRGEPLAQVALSNNNEAVLHFEMRKNNKPINPLPYLK